MNTEQQMGSLIAKRRKIRGWSQAEFARRLFVDGGTEIDQTAICRIESGQRRVSAVELFLFARILGVSPSIFDPVASSVVAMERLRLRLSEITASRAGLIAEEVAIQEQMQQLRVATE